MTVDPEALERLYAAATKGPWTLLHKNGVLEIDDAHPYKTGTAVVHWAGFDSSNKPPKEKLANAQLIVDLVNALPALLSELRALREDAGRLEISRCTVCAGVPSDGFYTGCMIQDGALQKPEWACDGNGNLVRWKAAIDAARRKP